MNAVVIRHVFRRPRDDQILSRANLCAGGEGEVHLAGQAKTAQVFCPLLAVVQLDELQVGRILLNGCGMIVNFRDDKPARSGRRPRRLRFANQRFYRQRIQVPRKSQRRIRGDGIGNVRSISNVFHGKPIIHSGRQRRRPQRHRVAGSGQARFQNGDAGFNRVVSGFRGRRRIHRFRKNNRQQVIAARIHHGN